ncbi:hypothetical protein EDB92DRAFT_107537 [Lactarius akahatsu]|uniref:DUF6535 domain-containing protein n=1 Tax=Lactarius akahatsu TaxID=416441 RepID=A0AAD4LK03_9AGAM|nr:hypothetical protein EDB92DRAFT_107537 [Lactarius akahatsu]
MSPGHQYIPLPLSGHVSTEAAVVAGDSQDQIPRKQDHKSSRAAINFTDGSDILFSINEKTYESDSKLIQNWREDANGLILLSGLVSATVAGFLSQSYFASRTSSQDVSAFYLAQIYQLQASLNSSLISSELSPPTPAATPEFSHFLWFTSLTISLGCSVGATLAQEWVPRYTLLTEPQYSPPRRARIRECIAQDRFLVFIPLFLGVLNALLHASIYLFLCGLSFLTITGDSPIFVVVDVLYLLSGLLCGALMAVPTVAPRSLLVPPFSPIYRRGTDSPLTGLPIQLREVEKDVPTRTSTLDTRAMSWLLHSLTHEQELESFLLEFLVSINQHG